MSWQLGAAAVLVAGLAGGTAWYERSRPDARVVALVATLAALAALGRVAFAAVPNVKPSTDIVLVAGYALGAAPGFMVGALSGLASNFFFGQGPWTPWQMAAWAAAGVAGAGLATLTRGRIGRLPLAGVCLAVGFLFTAVQDVGDWVNFSDHSPRSLEVYVGKGVGFDLVHAAGCLVFALLFGPALLRSLRRFTRRLEIRWLSPDGAVVPALLALAGGAILGGSLAGGLVSPARAATGALAAPVTYLRTAQNRDGGFGVSVGAASQPLYSGWAALGLAGAGFNLAQVSHGGASLLAYEAAQDPTGDVGSIERTILVARAGGVDPRTFGGRDLLAALERHIGADGSVSEQTNLTEFAALALRAAEAPVSSRTLGWLARQQNSDGGFGFGTAGGASDPDDTGAALEALAAAGGPRGVIARAAAYLRASQDPDGGYATQGGGASDAQSTAWAIQGLLAAGVDPDSVRRGRSLSPLAYLRGLIAPDGHVRYARGVDQTPVWVTGEALTALARRPFPLAPVISVAAPAGSARAPAAQRVARRTAHRSVTPLRARSHTASAPTAAANAAATSQVTGAGTAAGHPLGRAPRSQSGRGDPLALGSLAYADATAIMSAVERLLAPVGLAVPPGT